jgi:mRNA interferase RelE/StbE
MNLTFSRTSLKSLAKCQKKIRANIVEAIGELPDKGDIQKLKGQALKNVYRLRVGEYRVVYLRDGDEILILKIETRGNIYQ